MDDVQKLRKLKRFFYDIISFGELLNAKLSNIVLEDLLAEPDLLHATTYRLQCLSEATMNAPTFDPTIADRNPRGIGNRIRHEYGDIRTDIILETASGNDVLSLIAVAKAKLERHSS